MPRANPDAFLSTAQYETALEALHIVTVPILLEFARNDGGLPDIIIRNIVARACAAAKAIFSLWETQDYQDCWILYRCLVDRLFLLCHLNMNHEFEAFEEWSFLRQYNAMNTVRSDSDVSETHNNPLFTPSAEQNERARRLRKKQPKWSRPRAECVAQALDMQFLYRYAYDHASTHVHPMANDGDQDFYRLTGLQPRAEFPSQVTVLSNTLLIETMILQEALNASALRWHRLLYDCIEGVRHFIETGDSQYLTFVARLGMYIEQGFPLSKSTLVNEDSSR